MNIKKRCSFVSLFGLLLLVFTVFNTTEAATTSTPSVTPEVLTASCTTHATGMDGVRHNCYSKMETITAPKGYLFYKHSLKGGETSAMGSEHHCTVKWSDWAEVSPGSIIKQPRKLSIQAYALGPKGHGTGRGREKCRYTVNMVQ